MKDKQYRLTVEAFARPTVFMEPIDSKLATLRQLATEGVIDDLSFHVWGDEIPLSSETPYQEAIEAFERFRAWADQHDVEIEPPFAVRTESSRLTDTERTILKTPVMCLAVYADDLLSNVFPQTRPEGHVSVKEAIASLRTGELELYTLNPDVSPAPPTTCPDCGKRLVNVQGLGVCQRCDTVSIGAGVNREALSAPSDDRTVPPAG